MTRQPIFKTINLNSHPIKVLLDESSSLWVCAQDCCSFLRRPNLLMSTPVYSLTDRWRNVVFDKGKPKAAITPASIEKAFASVKNENSTVRKQYDILVAWSRHLTIESFMKAPSDKAEAPVSKENEGKEIVLYYQGNPITAKLDGSQMINGSQMAKIFGKEIRNWTKLKATQDYIEALSSDAHIRASALIQVVKGGIPSEQGTFIHKDLAIEFARWLNPQFAVWCNEHIMTLMQNGFTATPKTLDDLINDPDLVISLANKIKEERAAKELAIQQRIEKEKQLKETSRLLTAAKPKAAYYDAVIESRELYSTHQIANELNLNYAKLKKILREHNVITSPVGKTIVNDQYTGWGETVRKSWKWNKTGRKEIFRIVSPNTPC